MPAPIHPRASLLVAALATLAAGCGGGEPAGGAPPETALGPLDGGELPGADLERIRVGDAAPDFVLESLAGGRIRLSDYRGSHEVILVFYRGHW